ncbi:hypothetical protein KCP78_20555 [Salmonella enterica subsp. enterica]|nr:hypothetical protein KCP78_20555 [Salmonella enterica subsp. enterica]
MSPQPADDEHTFGTQRRRGAGRKVCLFGSALFVLTSIQNLIADANERPPAYRRTVIAHIIHYTGHVSALRRRTCRGTGDICFIISLMIERVDSRAVLSPLLAYPHSCRRFAHLPSFSSAALKSAHIDAAPRGNQCAHLFYRPASRAHDPHAQPNAIS